MLFRSKREHAALTEERRIRAGKAGGEREPHLKNGGKNEMLELLSELLTFAGRHGAENFSLNILVQMIQLLIIGLWNIC